MSIIKFDSQIEIVGRLDVEYNPRAIEQEPMLFSADKNFAMTQGGYLTRLFLTTLPPEWVMDDLIVDSRSHMLMPGFYPAIPGYHLDDVPHTRADGQPDHVDPEYHAEHVMCIVGDCSRTEFALGEISLVDPPIGDKIYGVWTKLIYDAVGDGTLKSYTATPNDMIKFNWQTWHRAMPTTHDGWRWFIRATRYSKRPVVNKLRSQVQVYMDVIDAGW